MSNSAVITRLRGDGEDLMPTWDIPAIWLIKEERIKLDYDTGESLFGAIVLNRWNDRIDVFTNYCAATNDNMNKLFLAGYEPHELLNCHDFALGIHHCDGDSAWGKCVYFHKDDSAHDFCLYCGNPEERK